MAEYRKIPDAFRYTPTPESIFKRWEDAKGYNTDLGLYDTVKLNERFVFGDQWEGVVAPDIDKPQLNFLRRVVQYFISMIVSDNIGVSVTAQTADDSAPIKAVTDWLSEEIGNVMENTSLTSKLRRCVRDAAIDGDCCVYAFWDKDAEELCAEVLDNTCVLFGAPGDRDAQKQPYILLERSRQLRDVRLQAYRDGVEGWDSIQPDEGAAYRDSDAPAGYGAKSCTTVTMFYKNEETGTVWMCEAAKGVMLHEPVDTGMLLYPIAWMNWDERKGSYHGVATVTGLIPNQIAVNRLWAGAVWHQRQMAFPKVFYNRQRIRNWTNRPGEAVAVDGSGPMKDDVAMAFSPPSFSANLIDVVEKTISMTRDFMGASDAALGNIRPENTSAIIAVQKAASVPLELQRMACYQFVEDIVRVLLELIRVCYGVRELSYTETSTDPISGQTVEQERTVSFDVGKLSPRAIKLNVDVGEAAYWSELMQVQTLDNLFAKGIITDAETYLESVPDKYLPHKSAILEQLRRQKQSTSVEDVTQTAASQMMGGSGYEQ